MPNPRRDEDGFSRRVCRACGRNFMYPDVSAQATRKYCSACAVLPKPILTTFEHLNRRINQLEKKLAKAQTGR